MQKSIEVKPKFLLVIGVQIPTGSATGCWKHSLVIEFEDEKELRATALSKAEAGYPVKAYKISSVSDVESYAALKMRWK